MSLVAHLCAQAKWLGMHCMHCSWAFVHEYIGMLEKILEMSSVMDCSLRTIIFAEFKAKLKTEHDKQCPKI